MTASCAGAACITSFTPRLERADPFRRFTWNASASGGEPARVLQWSSPSPVSQYTIMKVVVLNVGFNRRVKLLVLLLSRVLKHQLAHVTYAALKTLRLSFIALRDRDDPEARVGLMARIDALGPEALGQIIRAHNIYFSLVNIADEVANLAERRKLVACGGHMWSGSFHDTLMSLHAAGVTEASLEPLLQRLAYVPVTTAHPSEAKRRTIKGACATSSSACRR